MNTSSELANALLMIALKKIGLSEFIEPYRTSEINPIV